jgi:hypothetical protein
MHVPKHMEPRLDAHHRSAQFKIAPMKSRIFPNIEDAERW